MERLLIVEDNPDQARRIAGLLEAAGYAAQVAEDGARALEYIASTDPELVVTELNIAGVDGLHFVEAVAREHPSIPVIVITAFDSCETAMRALKLGAASYVPKRFLDEWLVETVENVLDLSRTRRLRTGLLRSLVESESRFVLRSDPAQITPLVDYIMETLGAQCELDEISTWQTTVALQEAVTNAVHHGNLEVSSDLKSEEGSAYQKLIEERAADPSYRDRKVVITVRVTSEEMSFVIEDEGVGFDLALVPDPTDPENLLRPSGRGLYLIGSFMDGVVHNVAGNRITISKRLAEAPGQPSPSRVGSSE